MRIIELENNDLDPLDNRRDDIENLLNELDNKSEFTHRSLYRPNQNELNSVGISHSASSIYHSRGHSKTIVSLKVL
jgi:hypothetical protein